MTHQRFISLVLGCLCVHAAPALAQIPYAVGTRQVAWKNTTGSGTEALLAEVHYPALTTGIGTPVAPNTGGWPVIVFLHGYGASASSYQLLADSWARAGYAVVLSDTCLFDWVTQPLDGAALYSAVLAANANATGYFAGSFDTQRIAIAGHSMGGASVGTVLNANPGYACGFAIAPVTPLFGTANHIEVPFGIVAGAGDWVTPPATFADVYYADLASDLPLKFYHLLDSSVDHLTVVGFSGATGPALEHTSALGLALFDSTFGTGPAALQVVASPTPSSPLLQAAQFAAARPKMWINGALHVGQSSVVSILSQPGFSALIAAADLGPALPTPYGDLLVDAATVYVFGYAATNSVDRSDFTIDVPNDPQLIGFPMALQGSGPSTAATFELGNAALLLVEP